MPGADVFSIAPDEVHKSVEILFDVEAEVQRQTADLVDGTADTAQSLADADLAIGAALAEAAAWWKADRAGGFTALCGNTGEYLAVCAESAVEVDDYNAGDFASLADHDRYPGRANEHASSRPDW
ncbi:hypothetical protein AB0A73_12860 [Glycomyces sp. NPDC047369]